MSMNLENARYLENRRILETLYNGIQKISETFQKLKCEGPSTWKVWKHGFSQ